jgi:outer membrane receptor protein involved in Fe transport
MARKAIGKASLRAGLDVNGRFGLEAIGRTQSFDPGDAATTLDTEVSVEDAARTDWGAFAEGDLPLVADRLVLAAGLRGDTVRTRNSGGYFGDRSATNGSLSGFGSLTWHLAPEWSASLQYSRGFRDALLSDRYFRGISGRGFVVGNPDLEPETTNQLDLAARGRLGPVGLAASGYLYRIRSLIERFRVGNDFNFRNRGEEEIRGLELEADARLHSRLVLRATGTWMRGRILDDGSAAAGVPPRNVSLSVDHALTDALWYRARLLLVEADDEPGLTEVAIPGYARVDLSVGWRFPGGFDVTLVGRNLLDKAYADSADELHVTAPGRSAMLTIGGRF